MFIIYEKMDDPSVSLHRHCAAVYHDIAGIIPGIYPLYFK